MIVLSNVRVLSRIHLQNILSVCLVFVSLSYDIIIMCLAICEET